MQTGKSQSHADLYFLGNNFTAVNCQVFVRLRIVKVLDTNSKCYIFPVQELVCIHTQACTCVSKE